MDVTDESSVEDAARRLSAETAGRLDLIVNTAGILHDQNEPSVQVLSPDLYLFLSSLAFPGQRDSLPVRRLKSGFSLTFRNDVLCAGADARASTQPADTGLVSTKHAGRLLVAGYGSQMDCALDSACCHIQKVPALQTPKPVRFASNAGQLHGAHAASEALPAAADRHPQLWPPFLGGTISSEILIFKPHVCSAIRRQSHLFVPCCDI